MQKIFSQLSDMLSADIIKFIIVFCVIGVIFSGLFNYILSYYFDFDVESIKQWVNSYDQYAPIAYILLVLTTLFWAGNFIVGKAASLFEIPPFTLNFYRWLFAWLILAPFTLPEIIKKKKLYIYKY